LIIVFYSNSYPLIIWLLSHILCRILKPLLLTFQTIFCFDHLNNSCNQSGTRHLLDNIIPVLDTRIWIELLLKN